MGTKHSSRGHGSQAPVGKLVTVQVPLELLEVLCDTCGAFHDLCIRTSQQVLIGRII